jgi:hypothetical protein
MNPQNIMQAITVKANKFKDYRSYRDYEEGAPQECGAFLLVWLNCIV